MPERQGENPAPEKFLQDIERLASGNLEPEAARQVILQMAKFSLGPIPPAEVLAEYDQLHPGLAQEIIGWTREQQTHRRSLEVLVTEGSEKRQNRSQAYALVVALAGIVAASIVGIYGSAWAAAVIVVACVGGPATTSVLARWLDLSPGKSSNRDRVDRSTS